jgi:hypothetical protein
MGDQPTKDPILFGTEKDYAWDAYEKAFDANALQPDHAVFDKWFDDVYLQLGSYSLHDRLHAAWGAGVQARNIACTVGFGAWWQKILDSQPVISEQQQPS